MSTPKDPAPKAGKKRFRLRNLLLGILLGIVLLLAILHVITPPIATRVINGKLPGLLHTDANLKGLSLNLARGAVGLRGLTIEQPEGFEGEPLLSLNHFSTVVPPLKAMEQDPIVIQSLHLEGLDVRMLTDSNGVTNLSKLSPPAETEPEPDVETPETPEEAAPLPPLWIQRILLENINLLVEDVRKDLKVQMRDLKLEVRDLHVSGDPSSEPGDIRLSLQLVGKRVMCDVDLQARVGVIEAGRTPPLQATLAIVGFDLDMVDGYLPRGARSALGGNGFDLTCFVQIGAGETPKDQKLSGTYALNTDKGRKYNGKFAGNLEEPDVPLFALLTEVFGSFAGRFGGLGVNVAQSGVEVAKTVANTGVTAVKGAAGTAKGLVEGAFNTVKGVATLDGEGAMKGLKQATIGTVTNVTGTVTSTAGEAGKGLSKTADTALGKDDQQNWWGKTTERLSDFKDRSTEWFSEHAFPGREE